MKSSGSFRAAAAALGATGYFGSKRVECKESAAGKSTLALPKNSCAPFADITPLDTKKVRVPDLPERNYLPKRIVSDDKLGKLGPDQASHYYDAKLFPAPEWRPLPTFSLDEVQKHQATHPQECWLTYRGGVYDMTTFLDCHPGGVGRIEMVAGSDLEAYWKVYHLHNRPHIQNLIEHYRIGNLSPEDAKKATAESVFADYYENDPARPAVVENGGRIPSTRPWNHEPKRKQLVESFFTPNELFFVRNHNFVPDLKEEDYTLEIDENDECGIKNLSLTLSDLKKLPKTEIIATLQCAGNRQEDYVTEDNPLYVAPHWTGGAIGTAKWGGVKVRDVLKHAGMDVDGFSLGTKKYPNARVCMFVAEDTDETGVPYAGVLPIEKATDPWGDALLAYEMNGETLPRDHGYPIRLLAPGHAGCRNIKWIRNIQVADKPSDLDSGSKLDRHFNGAVSFMDHLRHGDDHVRLELGPVIQTMPITSIVCVPEKNSDMCVAKDAESVDVKGVAYVGGGRGVCRVEVSADGGKTFHAAEQWGMRENLDPQWGQGRNWAWVQWEQNVPLNDEQKAALKKGEDVEVEIVCKAIDGDFNSQPEEMKTSYNSLGVCINHWDRIPVTLKPQA
jgi:sulfite oxidase